jgi:hypothetical protein
MTAKATGNAPWARMYRVVHGWPMLAGLPIPLFLLVMLAGILGVFGASMFGGLTAVALAVAGAFLWWGGLTLLFRQDQAAAALLLLRRRARLAGVIASFSPSWVRMVIGEEPDRG